ncbi:hypothetical protein ACS0TY_028458 [Phlomoides rotata]
MDPFAPKHNISFVFFIYRIIRLLSFTKRERREKKREGEREIREPPVARDGASSPWPRHRPCSSEKREKRKKEARRRRASATIAAKPMFPQAGRRASATIAAASPSFTQSGPRSSTLYKIYEFEDELDLEHHELHYNPVTTFFLPYHGLVQGSVNGLLLLRSFEPNGLCICNPVTHDYIEIQCPQDFVYRYPQVVTYGFGASKITSQHKVVRIFHDCILDENTHQLMSIPKFECHVYTLGTRSWRRVQPGPPLGYSCHTIGAFLNGNLHRLVSDLKGNQLVSCFDLETVLFSTFSLPPLPRSLIGLFPLGDCLCLSSHSFEQGDDIVIWLMKEYGDEKSWTKEFVISKSPNHVGESYEVIRPIKVFKDGDILMGEEFSLFYYSNKT